MIAVVPPLTAPMRSVCRKRQPGANLALLCMMGVVIIGFVGVCMYGGMQAYVEGDLQKAAMGAAMAGASAYYGKTDAQGSPSPDSAGAISAATTAFNSAVSNSSLKGFNVTLNGVTNNDSNDSITVDAKATISLPFLGLVGISQMQVNALATACALRYEPTIYTGPVKILPVAGDINSYSANMKLNFPVVDGPGTDLYVEQDAALQQPYVVEVCNSSSCYNVGAGATPVGTSQKITLADGSVAIVGTAAIDLQKAGVRKGSMLRFTHGNVFDSWTNGAANPPPTVATPLTIRRVMMFGYGSACVDKDNCYLPEGFIPVH